MITKLGETLYHGSRREVSMLNPLNLSKDKPMGLVIREMRPNALQEIYGTF